MDALYNMRGDYEIVDVLGSNFSDQVSDFAWQANKKKIRMFHRGAAFPGFIGNLRLGGILQVHCPARQLASENPVIMIFTHYLFSSHQAISLVCFSLSQIFRKRFDSMNFSY